MQDINHCISEALVESNSKHTLFVLEDLTGIITSFVVKNVDTPQTMIASVQ